MNERTAPDTVHNAPTIGDNSPQAHASVQDRAGLYIGIVALILAALSVGMQLTTVSLIDAKVEARLAIAQAEMHMASTNALLAKDRTDKVAAALEARGLIKLENH